MKKKLPTLYALFWATFSVIIFLSSSDNPPNGHTGAPPTGNSCAAAQNGCHSGGTGVGSVSIIGLPANIAPNTMYPIQVRVSRANSVPQLAGFQLVVQDATHANAGTLANPGPSSTLQTASGKTYFEHNPAAAFSGNIVTYTVNWTSPASASNPIKMYAAANLADGDFTSDGDVIVLTNATATLAPAIGVSMSGTNISCFDGDDGTATASASGGGGPPYTYEWSNTDTGPSISFLTAGTYSVTVTNPSGGIGMGSITLTQPASPLGISILSQTSATCTSPLGSASALANGGTPGYTYVWSNGAMGETAALPAGNHSLDVTDANGCADVIPVSIPADTMPPVAEAGNCQTLDCNAGTATLDGSGSSQGLGITYQWTGPGIASGGNTPTPAVIAAGTYHLLVTNSFNGCTSSDSVAVVACPTSLIMAGGPTTFCPGGSVLLTASGGTSYLWNTTETSAAITATAGGTYSVSVTTANGCVLMGSQTVTLVPAQSTWTGAGDGLLWSDPANWSGGSLPISCQEVVLPAVGNVTVPPGFGAVGRMLEVVLGAVLSVEVTGGLEVGN